MLESQMEEQVVDPRVLRLLVTIARLVGDVERELERKSFDCVLRRKRSHVKNDLACIKCRSRTFTSVSAEYVLPLNHEGRHASLGVAYY